jgi:carboxymethylenebutenolidase
MDSNGLKIESHDGRNFSAYVSKPESQGSHPGLLLIQEIFGVNKNMRSIADRYSKAGFYCAVPDLFWRLETGLELDPAKEAEMQKAFDLYGKFDVNEGIKDLQSTMETMRALPDLADRVGCIGFCLGGKLAFLMATRTDIDCIVSYYGVGIEHDLAEADKIKKPVLMHIAEKDQHVPPEAQRAIKQKLSHDRNVLIHTYAGCDHAFARKDGDNYNQAAANLADERTMAFLKEHLF